MRELILRLYKNRCIRCRRQSNTVHEKKPKSLEPNWDTVENRVVLCNECHDQVHAEGAMNWFDILSTLQEEVLVAYYGTSSFELILERL